MQMSKKKCWKMCAIMFMMKDRKNLTLKEVEKIKICDFYGYVYESC